MIRLDFNGKGAPYIVGKIKRQVPVGEEAVVKVFKNDADGLQSMRGYVSVLEEAGLDIGNIESQRNYAYKMSTKPNAEGMRELIISRRI